MPRDGSLTPRDLAGKLGALRVECDKCGRSGRYRVTTLAKTIGWDGKLMDWLYSLTKDCPRKRSPGLSDPCGARYGSRRSAAYLSPAAGALSFLGVQRSQARIAFSLIGKVVPHLRRREENSPTPRLRHRFHGL